MKRAQYQCEFRGYRSEHWVARRPHKIVTKVNDRKTPHITALFDTKGTHSKTMDVLETAPSEQQADRQVTSTDDRVREVPATGARTRPWTHALWAAHWVLRIWLAISLLTYGWSKVFLIQMGRTDYADALITHGEMSPMGLLWDFVAYSPMFQILSGIVEVLAGVLLLCRRTAWLGALIGALAMGFVFILNLGYDVPVKILALILTIGFLIALIPAIPRIARFVAGKATGPAPLPQVVPWPKLEAVTRWLAPAFALLIAAGTALPWATMSATVKESNSALPGVYAVVEDAAAPAAQLRDDHRWQHVAIGKYLDDEQGSIAIRYANTDLQDGKYRIIGPDIIEVKLYPVLEGDRPLERDFESTTVLTWTTIGPDRIALRGENVDVQLASDPELRYLFDREFSWAPTTPVNR